MTQVFLNLNRFIKLTKYTVGYILLKFAAKSCWFKHNLMEYRWPLSILTVFRITVSILEWGSHLCSQKATFCLHKFRINYSSDWQKHAGQYLSALMWTCSLACVRVCVRVLGTPWWGNRDAAFPAATFSLFRREVIRSQWELATVVVPVL